MNGHRAALHYADQLAASVGVDYLRHVVDVGGGYTSGALHSKFTLPSFGGHFKIVKQWSRGNRWGVFHNVDDRNGDALDLIQLTAKTMCITEVEAQRYAEAWKRARSTNRVVAPQVLTATRPGSLGCGASQTGGWRPSSSTGSSSAINRFSGSAAAAATATTNSISTSFCPPGLSWSATSHTPSGSASTLPPSISAVPTAEVLALANKMFISGVRLDRRHLEHAVLDARCGSERRRLQGLMAAIQLYGRARISWWPYAWPNGRWRAKPEIRGPKEERIFVVADEGHLLLEIDLIAAAITAVRLLLGQDGPDWLNNGVDAAQALADELTTRTGQVVGRDAAKLIFAVWRGGSSYARSASIAGVSRDVAAAAHDLLFEALPAIRDLWAWIGWQQHYGWPLSVPTSRRTISTTAEGIGRGSRGIRQLTALLEQLVIADIVDAALVQLDHELVGFDAKIVAHLHDGALLEVAPEHVERVARLAEQVFEERPYWTAPLAFRPRLRFGRSWGDLQTLSPDVLTASNKETRDE